MGWYIRAFSHVTDIAQETLVDDCLVIFFIYAMHFAIFGRIDQIKHGRKRAEQVDATATAMTQIKHAFHFGMQLILVVKVWILPV
jgi:hypothetical protein